MARRKRSSLILERAERRLASLRSISPTLSLDNGLTVQTFSDQIDDLHTKLSAYNTELSTLDQLHTSVVDAEKTVGDLSEQMLLAVAVKFGKSSVEYKMAGGVRKSDRKRPVRLASPAPAVD
jgi:uncharacterized protein YukE